MKGDRARAARAGLGPCFMRDERCGTREAIELILRESEKKLWNRRLGNLFPAGASLSPRCRSRTLRGPRLITPDALAAPLSRSLSLSLSRSLALSLSRALALSRFLALALALSHTLALSLALSPSLFSHSPSLSISLSLLFSPHTRSLALLRVCKSEPFL